MTSNITLIDRFGWRANTGAKQTQMMAKWTHSAGILADGRVKWTDFATERTHSLDAAAAKRAGRPLADVAAEGAASIPTGRYGDPAEFGAMVAFLAGKQSAYTTGAFFRLDGGASRGSS